MTVGVAGPPRLSPAELEQLDKLRGGWRLSPPSPPSARRREARRQHLIEVIETLADELYDDHLSPEWRCPACHQVARIRRRAVRTVAHYVSLISDGSAHLNHPPSQCGMETRP